MLDSVLQVQVAGRIVDMRPPCLNRAKRQVLIQSDLPLQITNSESGIFLSMPFIWTRDLEA